MTSARAALQPAARPAGHGAVHAHHGEIVQGVFHTREGKAEHGLVTLPCTLYRTHRAWEFSTLADPQPERAP